MARRDLAAELAKRPLAFKLAVLGGILGFLGFFYWQFFYSTLSDDQRKLTTDRKKLVKQEATYKERKQEYIELLQQKELLDDQIKKNRITLPASSELPAFFMHLQKQAAAAGVTIVKWSRRNESAVETYVRVPVQLHITGTFYQIKNYFRLLGKTDRIISIAGLSLKPGKIKNDEIVLNASFTAITFRQKDKPPDTTLGEDEPEQAANGAAPKRGSRAGAGRFAGAATAEQDAIQNEVQDTREQGAGAEQDAPAAGVNRLTNPGAEVPQ